MTPRKCGWCPRLMPEDAPPGQRFHNVKCRQSAFRLRRRTGGVEVVVPADATPMRVAYLDPPYPGMAQRYYGEQPTFAGEVDHHELVARAVAAGLDGWALSTSAAALDFVLPVIRELEPRGFRVCAWVKTIGAAPPTLGIHNTWEPLIVVGGRALRPGVRDWLATQPARGGGDLPGRKPIAFAAWLFALLGMLPGDTIDEWYPGSRLITRAWAERSRLPIASALEERRTVSRAGE